MNSMRECLSVRLGGVGEIFFFSGDKNTIDRWGPDGVSAFLARCGGAVAQGADGLSLSLRPVDAVGGWSC